MAKNTSIEWCHHTWTLVVGCDPVSPACAKCYAALMAARLESMGQKKYIGLATRVGNIGKWTGKVRFDESVLDLPLRTRKPGRWFLTSMGDIAHKKVTDAQIAAAFDVMERADHHTFLVLTKRIARFATLLQGDPLANAFLGCTAENQVQADAHRPHMQALAERGWRTFVSYEPALGPVNWAGWEFLDQLISGGESGHGARPSHPDWHRAARDFAAQHDIAYLFKQWGQWTEVDTGMPTPLVAREGDPEFDVELAKHDGFISLAGHFVTDPDDMLDGVAYRGLIRPGKKAAGRLLDGVEHNGFPGA